MIQTFIMNGMKVVVPVGEKIVFEGKYAYINNEGATVLVPSPGPNYFWFYHGFSMDGAVVTLLKVDEYEETREERTAESH